MRLHLPDMDEFLAWMDQAYIRYVVLRNGQNFLGAWPKAGGKDDVDLLVDDHALPIVLARYGGLSRRRGIKCDLYDAGGSPLGAYLGGAYYPPALAARLLDQRERLEGRFWVPGPEAWQLGLMFHIAYHKAERSKIDRLDPARSTESKYIAELEMLAARTGKPCAHTLSAFHQRLVSEGVAAPYRQLAAILANDFSRGVKSRFLAEVVDGAAGEMNLFVIRKAAADRGQAETLLSALAAEYEILADRPISWLTRLATNGKMRGGKWRQGGPPVRAVVVFDRAPLPAEGPDATPHPFVFNGRQFMKKALRREFSETTGLHPRHNPIHSTDNEAEALGHLPLYFTDVEREALFRRIEDIRAGGR